MTLSRNGTGTLSSKDTQARNDSLDRNGTPDRDGTPAVADFRPHRVVVLALDGVLPFELGIPHRIFGRPKDARRRPCTRS